jgi:2-octaprenyl-6-methoxyphenol hydroxylase
VVAEGGVFADQARKAVAHDYGQTAWVGTVTLAGATPGWPSNASPARARWRCCRCARADGQARAAHGVVRDQPTTTRWPALTDAQRLAVLDTLLPARGRARWWHCRR